MEWNETSKGKIFCFHNCICGVASKTLKEEWTKIVIATFRARWKEGGERRRGEREGERKVVLLRKIMNTAGERKG